MISSNVQSKRELFYLLRIVFPNLQFGAAQAALLAPGVLSDLSRGQGETTVTCASSHWSYRSL